MSREQIFAEIDAEREYQEGRWGTDFDDQNTPNDWVSYITRYLGNTCGFDIDPAERRQQLVKVAALAVAAIETQERVGVVPRHYDPVA